jgi:hypothetical protein
VSKRKRASVPEGKPIVAVWCGSLPPVRSIRWLDGVLAAAAKFGPAIAIAAGEPAWLDLAADRATRAGVAAAGVQTDLKLDYLGWAQIVAAAMRKLDVSTLLVDEASRRERFAEVAAIAELLDAVQLTDVVAIAHDGPVVHASRVNGRELQTLRVRGPAVFGVRIAGPPIDEYPTPMPTSSMRRFDLQSLGLDALVLGHRALPQFRANPQSKKSLERVAEHLAVHLAPRGS